MKFEVDVLWDDQARIGAGRSYEMSGKHENIMLNVIICCTVSYTRIHVGVFLCNDLVKENQYLLWFILGIFVL